VYKLTNCVPRFTNGVEVKNRRKKSGSYSLIDGTDWQSNNRVHTLRRMPFYEIAMERFLVTYFEFLYVTFSRVQTQKLVRNLCQGLNHYKTSILSKT
jgi:hypothetical protein